LSTFLNLCNPSKSLLGVAFWSFWNFIAKVVVWGERWWIWWFDELNLNLLVFFTVIKLGSQRRSSISLCESVMLLTNIRKISRYPDVTGHLKTYRCATSETCFLLPLNLVILSCLMVESEHFVKCKCSVSTVSLLQNASANLTWACIWGEDGIINLNRLY